MLLYSKSPTTNIWRKEKVRISIFDPKIVLVKGKINIQKNELESYFKFILIHYTFGQTTRQIREGFIIGQKKVDLRNIAFLPFLEF